MSERTARAGLRGDDDMRRCRLCTEREGVWTWQPFGPEGNFLFTLPGNHYGGFPTLPVCDRCKANVERHATFRFTYRGVVYQCDGDANLVYRD
jgi:hypothetical protein